MPFTVASSYVNGTQSLKVVSKSAQSAAGTLRTSDHAIPGVPSGLSASERVEMEAQLKYDEELLRVFGIGFPDGGAMITDRIRDLQLRLTRQNLVQATAKDDTDCHPEPGCSDDDPCSSSDPQLRVELMPHQKRCLDWMSDRERQKPAGGILADDMGMGKTISVLALIAQKKRVPTTDAIPPQLAMLNVRLHAGGTLVVAPVSLVDQWAGEAKDKIGLYVLKVHVFHGPRREREDNPRRLAQYDLVITSYDLVKNELASGSRSAFAQIAWARVVLDEAHVIKNPDSLTSKACCRLVASSRWCVTGTPVHNNLWDLYALIRFLRFHPFDEKSYWKELTVNPTEKATTRLHALIDAILLRRMKNERDVFTDKPIVSLTGRLVEEVRVVMTGIEAEIYHQLVKEFRCFTRDALQIQAERKTSSSRRNKQHKRLGNAVSQCVLVPLLRIRQAAVHLSLIAQDIEAQALLKDKEVKAAFSRDFRSAKLCAILERLSKIMRNHEKCVIVSQWTAVLGVIEHHLRKMKIRLTSITGDIPAAERQQRVDTFNKEGSGVHVILLSLTAGGVGLNLTGGSHLFVVDPHWNPALEQQACDRIYRIGQSRDVHIHKFICNASIEEKVVELQARKRQLADNVLGGTQKETLTMDDVKFLLEEDVTTESANEDRYCVCNQASFGAMIMCDGKACKELWFHLTCVGVVHVPVGEWYCQQCASELHD